MPSPNEFRAESDLWSAAKWQLIEKYRGLIRVPLRLYADGSRSQGGKPRSACDPIPVLHSVGQRLARAGKISPAAVDKVYEVRTHPILNLIYDRTCLASIFGQPPTYYTTDTNPANLEAADQQHAQDGVDPRCNMIAEELTALIQHYDPRLFFAFDSTLPEDEDPGGSAR